MADSEHLYVTQWAYSDSERGPWPAGEVVALDTVTAGHVERSSPGVLVAVPDDIAAKLAAIRDDAAEAVREALARLTPDPVPAAEPVVDPRHGPVTKAVYKATRH